VFLLFLSALTALAAAEARRLQDLEDRTAGLKAEAEAARLELTARLAAQEKRAVEDAVKATRQEAEEVGACECVCMLLPSCVWSCVRGRSRGGESVKPWCCAHDTSAAVCVLVWVGLDDVRR